jgi:hypothetical protein
MAVLNVVIARSYGMPAEAASDWVAGNALRHALTTRETAIMSGGEADASERLQVEAVQAFAWLLGLIDQLDAEEFCSDDLVARLPDLRRAEPMAVWSEKVKPRLSPADAAAQEWDLHYCITWASANANLTGAPQPGVLPAYVYWQRRRAFEFAFGESEWAHADWDAIDLST